MSHAKKVDSLRTVRRLIGRFGPVLWPALGVFALLLLRTALEVGVPFLVGRTVNALSGYEGEGGAMPSSYVTLLWVLAIVLLFKSVVHYLAQVAAARVGQDCENRLRADLFSQVTRLRFSYHDQNRSGKTIARSLRDMEKTKHFFGEVWFGYVEITLIVVAVVVMTFWAHWSYGLTVGAVFAVAISGTIFLGGSIAQMDRGVSDDYDHVTTALQENVAGARVVRAFGREPQEMAKFGGRMSTFTGAWARLERFWTGIVPWIGHLYHLALPMVVMVGAWRLTRGVGNIGEVVTVLLYIRTVHYRIRPLTRMVILGQQATASATRVFEVLDNTDVIASPKRPARLPAEGGDLRIEEVRFAHVGGPPVLRGVSLHVPPGGSLGILGVTGSGKSSLVQLVPRFYDADLGRILLDGIDVADLDVRELRAEVGLVFQEPFLFSGTVAENIAYGRPGIDRERIEACARLAAAHEFVVGLPQGYDTVIGERGVSLSGGQRQRLTIARALAMEPRVLIFDDATASVDAVTEKALFSGIRSAARGRTTLVISQRVTSVKWCDRIAVLEDGIVTAQGVHDELMRHSPLYMEIHTHQQLKGVVR